MEAKKSPSIFSLSDFRQSNYHRQRRWLVYIGPRRYPGFRALKLDQRFCLFDKFIHIATSGTLPKAIIIRLFSNLFNPYHSIALDTLMSLALMD